ncbi:GGDEF domain-containing protein [Armatimonas rosea]|uniref:Diguanylate cyclase (GGDEF)-like protein n=1 Tax=Armatimonas rosea TaxID=685828 RepID=A0A7W9W9Y0_ARMRO|nr:GGDEF domain-containing protein [Armatimonas rosea]MBB6052997.1 diguanylate cyclase (GGDEF)-like protein [Armatimonas rosea]
MRRGVSEAKIHPATLIGRILLLGGIFVPVFASLMVALQNGLSLPNGLWEAQRTTPWLWLLDLLPVALAFYSRFLSLPSTSTARSFPLLLSILTLLFSIPCSAMLFARQQAQVSTKALASLRQAGHLEMLVLRTHISYSQQAYGDVRQQLAQMAELRKTIQIYSPQAVQTSERVWSTYYHDALNRSLTLSTTLSLRDAMDKLVHALENDAKRDNNEASLLLLTGVAGTFVLMGLTLQLFYLLRQQESQLTVIVQKNLKTSQQLEMANDKLEDLTTQLTTLQGQLSTTATRDSLTKLHNRRSLDEHMASEWARALRYNQPLSILILDIDYFRAYNESFGAASGDAVLETIGTLLQHTLRTADIAARHGGEEFMILMPHTHEDEAVRIAERLRAGIQAAPWKHRAVTVSIGVAEKSPSMTRVAELTTAADVALYQAKKTRDRVCSYQSLPIHERRAA